VHIDHVVAAEKGVPSKVKRTFEELGGTRSSTRGDQTNESDIESPIEGLTILLSSDGEDVTTEVVEGKKPEDEKAFANQKLESFLDGVLPKGEVEADATWELSKAQILSVLRLDVHRGLYPPPARPEGGSGEGGGGGRRGGGRTGGMGGSEIGLLSAADWKGKAKLASVEEDVGGVKCAVIELELEASGEMAAPERAPGGGRRGGMLEPESGASFGNTYDITLEGKLAFAIKERRPVSLAIEGKMTTTMDNEGEGRDGGTFKLHVKRAGKFKLDAKVSEEAASDDSKKK
jgi:hypothetical protein